MFITIYGISIVSKYFRLFICPELFAISKTCFTFIIKPSLLSPVNDIFTYQDVMSNCVL